jgi:hypothetical protein
MTVLPDIMCLLYSIVNVLIKNFTQTLIDMDFTPIVIKLLALEISADSYSIFISEF